MSRKAVCLALTMLAILLTGNLYAQTASSAKTDENEGKVIRMDKQMFLDKIFDYTTGSTEWEYKGEKPAVIDFYAPWCGPCRIVSSFMKSLAKKYKGRIVVYKVNTDKQKELAAAMGIQSLPTVIFIPQTGQPQIIVGAAKKSTFQRAVEEVLLK